MSDFPKFSVVIAAGGSGSRFGGEIPKQFVPLHGEPVIIRALAPFCAHPHCRRIAVAVHPDWYEWMEQLVKMYKFTDCIRLIPGGKERGDSVYAGLKILDNPELVLIQDAARPFVTVKMINDCVTAAKEFGASAVAIPVTDTLKREINGYIDGTVDRNGIWRVQTPQAFRYKDIMNAYEMARKENYYGTDDCILIEKYTELKIKFVLGARFNMKITTQEDIIIAEALASRL